MRNLTKILIGAGVLVVAAVVAVVAVLGSMDFNQYKGLIAEQVKSATGRDLVIAGDLDLSISLSPAVVANGVTLSNAAWGSRPEMVSVERFEAQVKLLPLIGGNIEVLRLVAIKPDILIETDAQGVGNWVFDTAAPAAPAPAAPSAADGPGALPAVHRVEVRDARFTYVDGVSKQTTTLSLAHLEAGADSPRSPLTFGLAGRYNDKPFTASGKLGSIEALLSGNQPLSIELAAEAGGARLTVQGTIDDPANAKGLNLALSASGNSVADLAAFAGAEAPSFGPYSLAGRLGDFADGYALEGLKVKVAGSDVGGALRVALSGARPAISADLSSDKVVVDDFTGGPAAKGGASAPAQSGGAAAAKVFPSDPLPLEGLRAVDADVRYKAGQVVSNQVTIDNLDVALSLKSGKLTVTPNRADLFGGTVSGGVVLDGSSGNAARLSVDLSGKTIGLGQALLAVTGKPMVAGAPTDVTVKLDGGGASVAALMGSLNGRALVSVGKGEIDNAYVDLAGGDLFSQGMAALSGQKKTTELSCAVVNAQVKDGVATMDKGIAVETTAMIVQGTGVVNLKDETLEIQVRPRMTSAVGVSAGGLAEMVKLTGTLAQPTVGLDAVGAAKTALTVAGAVATGGMSLLAGSVAGRVTADNEPCRTALGLAPTKASDEPAATEQPAVAPSNPVEGMGKAIGEGLGKLLGR